MHERAEAMTDERLDSLERFRDVDFKNWQTDMERRFAEAFHGGDHVGHCRYHALMIESIEWRKRMWRAVMEKTIAGLVWGAMIFLGYAVLNYLKGLFK
jgi:hypothetical protein